MVLMERPFVRSTRASIAVNTLPRDQVGRRVVGAEQLGTLDDDESAIDMRPTTQLGRRRAYDRLLEHQRAIAEQHGSDDDAQLVTFHHMLCYYNVSPLTSRTPALIQELTTLLRMSANGSPDGGPTAFKLSNAGLMFRRRTGQGKTNRPQAVMLSPYTPVNFEDERFCFSALLLHRPWPPGGEAQLLFDEASGSYTSAVEMLKVEFPKMHAYARRAVRSQEHTEEVQNANGEPVASEDATTEHVPVHDNETVHSDADPPPMDNELNGVTPTGWSSADADQTVHWNVPLEKFAASRDFLLQQKKKVHDQVGMHPCESRRLVHI